MNSRDYFNSLAEKWDHRVTHDKSKIQHILKMTEIREGDKILDVGTGTGVLVPFLHTCVGRGGMVIAVDHAEKMIDRAERKFNYDNVKFIRGDVLKIKLKENSYDCIMCYSMFPHFENQQGAVKYLSRYLKAEGRFVIGHSNSRETINNLHKEASKYVEKDILPTAEIIQ